MTQETQSGLREKTEEERRGGGGHPSKEWSFCQEKKTPPQTRGGESRVSFTTPWLSAASWRQGGEVEQKQKREPPKSRLSPSLLVTMATLCFNLKPLPLTG